MNDESSRELELDHDKLITQILDRSREEYQRGSDAGESGAKIKEFLEETGMNSQAFSWAKAILKKLQKKDGQLKALDVINSLEAALPLLRDHIDGQGTFSMDLEPAQVADHVNFNDE